MKSVRDANLLLSISRSFTAFSMNNLSLTPISDNGSTDYEVSVFIQINQETCTSRCAGT
jgi:hypothetical protein